jgi:hypothetical protein
MWREPNGLEFALMTGLAAFLGTAGCVAAIILGMLAWRALGLPA